MAHCEVTESVHDAPTEINAWIFLSLILFSLSPEHKVDKSSFESSARESNLGMQIRVPQETRGHQYNIPSHKAAKENIAVQADFSAIVFSSFQTAVAVGLMTDDGTSNILRTTP